MKLFTKRSPTEEDAGTAVKMLTTTNTIYRASNGKAYESDVVRSCIRPYSKAIGKLQAKHAVFSSNGLKINPTPYLRILLEEPNPNMSMQMLLEKMAIQLELNNNAFAVITRDENGLVNGIYPINCVNAESFYWYSELCIKFTLKKGEVRAYPYRDIIHLRNDVNDKEVFGTPFGAALTNLMNVVTHTDQGIINAIKNSALIRWLLKYNVSLKKEDIEKNAKQFSEMFLKTSSDGSGVAVVDSKADAQQIANNDYVPNASQMDRTTLRIYNLLGTNEKIVQNKYTEDEWNAYYELKVEPTAMQLANEFTRKLFTIKERAFGNKIIFESSNLATAAMNTKLQLLQMVDRGAMTPNEWRQVLNLGPIEEGDKAIRRLDTAPVQKEKEGGSK